MLYIYIYIYIFIITLTYKLDLFSKIHIKTKVNGLKLGNVQVRYVKLHAQVQRKVSIEYSTLLLPFNFLFSHESLHFYLSIIALDSLLSISLQPKETEKN
jgi:hypothetical protein